MSILSATARRVGALVLLLLAATANTGTAQNGSARPRAWELRVASGALAATGTQRDRLKNAPLTAAQLTRVVRPNIAVTGTFAWARSRDVAAVGTPKLDVFTSDVGVEARSAERFADAPVSLRTFAGVGAGARSYNYRKLDVDATHNLAGYVAAGGELGMGRVAIRLEARDYGTGFRPLVGGGRSHARNDVVLMAALRFNRHPSQAR